MYNGIGLQTARGSGTNGHVQRNFAFVRPGKKENITYRTESDLAKLDAASNRPPNQELLDHERKRKVEVKCAELEEILEKQGYTAEEVASKVESFRNKLIEQKKNLTTKDEFGRVQVRETHQIAEAQQEKNARLREAFGISDYFVEGSSFDPDRKAKEELAKSSALQQELQLQKEAEKNYAKKYAPVRTPPHEEDKGQKDKSSESEQTNDEPRKFKGKKQKKKKSKKNKKEKSKKKKSRKYESSSEDSDSDTDDSGHSRKRKHKQKSNDKKRGCTSKELEASSTKRSSNDHKSVKKTETNEYRRHGKDNRDDGDKSTEKGRRDRSPSKNRNRSRDAHRSEREEHKRRKQSRSRSLSHSRRYDKHGSTDRNKKDRSRSPIKSKVAKRYTKSPSLSPVQRRRSHSSSRLRKSRSPRRRYETLNRRTPQRYEKKRSRSRSDSGSTSIKRNRADSRRYDRKPFDTKSQKPLEKRRDVSSQRSTSIRHTHTPEKPGGSQNNSDDMYVQTQPGRSLLINAKSRIDVQSTEQDRGFNKTEQHGRFSPHSPKLTSSASAQHVRDTSDKRWDVVTKIDNKKILSESSTLKSRTPPIKALGNKSPSSRSSSLSYSPAQRSPDRYTNVVSANKSDESDKKVVEDKRRSPKRSRSRERNSLQSSSISDMKSSRCAAKSNSKEKQSFAQKERNLYSAPVVRLRASSESESEVETIDSKSDDIINTEKSNEEQRDRKLLEALPGIAAKAKEKIKTISEAVICPTTSQKDPQTSLDQTDANSTKCEATADADRNLTPNRKPALPSPPKDYKKGKLEVAKKDQRYSVNSDSSDDTRSESSRSGSSTSSHSRSSSSYSSDNSNRSRSRSSRSPSIPRRRGSPSFLDRRRITSARKRPIPYHRSTPSSASSDSEDCDNIDHIEQST